MRVRQNTSRPLQWTQIMPQLPNFHHFGCPIYQLDSGLANGKSLNKWKSWVQLGINLGPSPSHVRSMALVLNPLQGWPQFLCKVDNFFKTVRPSVDSNPLPIEWKVRAGFPSDPTGTSGRTHATPRFGPPNRHLMKLPTLGTKPGVPWTKRMPTTRVPRLYRRIVEMGIGGSGI
jgi:hypothetical protein